MREPLRHRGFRLLFAAQCASFLGDAVFIIALAFAALEISGSAAALGTVLGSGSLVLVASFLVSGVWADRLPRLRVMVAADLLRVATQATLAVLLLTDTATIPLLVALNAVYSVGVAFFTPARTGLTPQLLEPRLLMAGNGLVATAENVMWMLGWAFGGLLVAAIGTGWAIGIDAGTFLASALLLSRIGAIPATTAPAERLPFLRELADGWREVTSRRWLWLVVIGATAYLALYEAPLQVVGPITMRAAYDGATSWGIMLSALGAGSAVGAALAASGRLRRPMRVSLWLFFGTVATPLLLVATAPLPVLFATNLLSGVGFGLFDTVWQSALQERIPADRISRVSAWDWMGSMAGMPLGFALAGGLVEAVGRDATLMAMAGSTFVVCVAFFADREVRSLGDRSAIAPAVAREP
ncbi:MAG: transporter [Thermoleophilia bacterium]|nr:transporter [Thermoleophilia bacterium]